jgi:hypothetical protein
LNVISRDGNKLSTIEEFEIPVLECLQSRGELAFYRFLVGSFQRANAVARVGSLGRRAP